VPRSPSGRICTKFGTGRHLPNKITCAKVYIDRLISFDSVGVEICHYPLTKRKPANALPMIIVHIDVIDCVINAFQTLKGINRGSNCI